PRVEVRGRDPALAIDLPAWCRARGHAIAALDTHDAITTATIDRAATSRWISAERAGSIDAVVDRAPATWGLAARGALVEAGGPAPSFPLADRSIVWADEAARLYAQATAAQWDPATAIPWRAPLDHPPEIEDAIVQIMTFLVENETAALVVPARFLAQVHPHFREVMQLLAVQVADEARHVEVFTRRATLRRATLGTSAAAGRASLDTLVREPDFAIASFLLNVLGEGSFLPLLHFIRDHAPDDATATVARLAAQDEARHVAFALAHLAHHADREQLRAAVERRHAVLASTAGLNEDVFDALVLLAAGSWEPPAIKRGHAAVVALTADMDRARRAHLERLGFSSADAETLSSLHTRNFM
ncbi:MAG TPA: hypothetical protein VL463_36120, partial [Kofleriaceae bacterium]|nr:hypothetical protein [Kofleriaceae bacterium]